MSDHANDYTKNFLISKEKNIEMIIERLNSMNYEGDFDSWYDEYKKLSDEDEERIKIYMEDVLPYIAVKDGKEHIYWSRDREEPVASFEEILNLPCANDKNFIYCFKPHIISDMLDNYYKVICVEGQIKENYHIFKEIGIEIEEFEFAEDREEKIYTMTHHNSYEEDIDILRKLINILGMQKQCGDFIIIDKTLVKYTGKDKRITIPEGIEYIANRVFACREEYKLIEKIVLPANLKVIGYSAFSGCTLLAEINIPKSTFVIGDFAFDGTKWLNMQKDDFVVINGILIQYNGNENNILIPDNVSIIWESSFIEYRLKNYENMRKININITLSKNIQIINRNGFMGFKGLKHIDLPIGLKGIGENAFCGCRKLESILIPESVIRIGACAFEGCRSLKKIHIPESVKELGMIATFCGCISLEEINIPKEITRIPSNFISGCTKIKNIDIPYGVKIIGDEAFTSCIGLTDIYIPKSVNEICYEAFSYCENIESIDMPEYMEYIGTQAFMGCKKLKKIKIPNGLSIIEDGLFEDCESLTDIEIPDGVTELGDMVFGGCKSLCNVIIPKSVKTIGKDVFNGCSELVITAERDSFAAEYAKKNKIKLSEI